MASSTEHAKIERLAKPNEHIQRDHIIRVVQRYCRDTRARLDKCLEDGHVYEKVATATKYLTSRPLLLACVIAIFFAIALPVLVFTIFAITTITCTFTGFILIEGTLLAFGTIILCGVLFSVMISLTILGISIALTYYICIQVCGVIKRI